MQQKVKDASDAGETLTKTKHLRIRMVLTGMTPLLFNPKNDAISPKEMTPGEQAALKVHQDAKGVPGIPSNMVYRTWVNGGKEVEVKLVGRTRKKLLTNSKGGSKVGSYISFEQTFFPFSDQKRKWDVNTQSINAENSQGKMTQQISHRPCWERWSVEIIAVLLVSQLSEKDFRRLVEISGIEVGIGSYSPRCGGYFGKYKITQWEHC